MTVVQLPEELVALREAIRTFIQREIAPKEALYAQEITETGTFAALEQEKKALRKRSAAEAQVRSYRAAVSAGVAMVAGTDAGTPDNPHGGVAREVAFMADAGLPVLQAVRAATAEAADLFGVADRGVFR